MKTIKRMIILLVITGLSNFIYGQNKGKEGGIENVKIKTSAQCEMCKKRIEDRLNNEKGVKWVNLDLATKYVEVRYDSKKTSVDKIRKAISEVGYDADSVKANEEAYSKLPGCCRKK